VKQRREGDDRQANKRRRWFRTEVGERERELRWRGNENFNPLKPVFNPKRKEKKKQKIIKNHFPRQRVVRVLCSMSAGIISYFLLTLTFVFPNILEPRAPSFDHFLINFIMQLDLVIDTHYQRLMCTGGIT
jgi:hypothetical protein